MPAGRAADVLAIVVAQQALRRLPASCNHPTLVLVEQQLGPALGNLDGLIVFVNVPPVCDQQEHEVNSPQSHVADVMSRQGVPRKDLVHAYEGLGNFIKPSVDQEVGEVQLLNTLDDQLEVGEALDPLRAALIH